MGTHLHARVSSWLWWFDRCTRIFTWKHQGREHRPPLDTTGVLLRHNYFGCVLFTLSLHTDALSLRNVAGTLHLCSACAAALGAGSVR